MHLVYMDVIEIFAKNDPPKKNQNKTKRKQQQKKKKTTPKLETRIQIIKIYCEGIGIEFGIEKCAMFIIKSVEKRNNGRIRSIKPGKHQNILGKIELLASGNIGRGHHQTSEIK